MVRFCKAFWEEEWEKNHEKLSTIDGYVFMDGFDYTRKKVLEVGCGDLFYSHIFNFYNSPDFFIGTDISLTALKRAKTKNKNFKLVVANATSLPFKDNSFDEVVAIETIALLGQDFYKALEEMKRVSKEKLTLYLTHKDIAIRIRKDTKYTDKQYCTLFHEKFGDISVFTEENVKALLSDIGLKPEIINPITEGDEFKIRRHFSSCHYYEQCPEDPTLKTRIFVKATKK